MTEQVTVQAAAPLVETKNATLGVVIDHAKVVDLPLNGRNFTQLLTLTPGATPVSTAQGSSVGFQDAGITGIPGSSFAKPALHGQENRSTLYYLDGIFNTDLRGPVYGVLPIVDVVREFKVQSGQYDAQFGRNAGANINVVTKSGTNELHGSIYHYFRNDVLNANSFFYRLKVE